MKTMLKILQFLPYPVISSSLNLFLFQSDILCKIDRSRLPSLVVPQELQVPLFSKIYRTRTSERILGKLKGFMDLPMDVVFEVSFHTLPSLLSKLWSPQCCMHTSFLGCKVSWPKRSLGTFSNLETI